MVPAEKRDTTKTVFGTDMTDIGKTLVTDRGLKIQTLDALWWLAGRAVDSGLAPKGCTTQADAFIRMQMGMEVGLTPMQALQNVANINGVPSVWGKAVKMLCIKSGNVEKWNGYWKGNDTAEELPDDFCAVIENKRVGADPVTYTYSVRDAKRQGLWKKSGPWTNAPKIMLMWRCIGNVAKFEYPDALLGLSIAEDMQDVIDVTADDVKPERPRNIEQLAEKLEAGSKPGPVDAVDGVDAVDAVDEETGEIVAGPAKKVEPPKQATRRATSVKAVTPAPAPVASDDQEELV